MTAPSIKAPGSMLPGLLAAVACVLLWWWGALLQEEKAAALSGQASTRKLLARLPAAATVDLARAQQSAALERSDLTRRLTSDRSEQMVRAELFYEVRQKCYEVKLNCLIRLSEAAPDGAMGQSAKSTSIPAGEPAPGLDALGVRRVRAIVSGALESGDITDLIAQFRLDRQRQWRINSLKLKQRTFELDLEQHILVAGGR